MTIEKTTLINHYPKNIRVNLIVKTMPNLNEPLVKAVRLSTNYHMLFILRKYL